MTNSENEFLTGLNEVEPILENRGFIRTVTNKKWPCAYGEYKSGDCNIVFLYGPSDWQIEMLVYTIKGKYSFAELLKIEQVVEWINNNRYQEQMGKNLKKEILWFSELLKFSLPLIS